MVPMPSSRRVRKTRIAISPRFATRALPKTATPYSLRAVALPDLLTITRALAVVPVVVLYAWNFHGHDYWATAVFCVAMVTDWFDGRIARSRGRTSPLGSLLDPVADKLLVLAALVMLVGRDVVPGWMVAAIVVRELLVTGLRLAALERGVVLDARDLGKLKTWAQPEIQAVVSAGLMGTDAADFHPNDSLTRIALEQLVAGLTHSAPQLVANPTAPVTMTGLDTRLVNALGLADTAKLFQQSASAAGLKPPSRFGTEAVARLLGLRTNHPAAQDNLELLPNQPATRAEAAYSAAQILRFSARELSAVQLAATSFTLPTLTAWQQRILQTAVRFIGFPYVWGGTSEKPESPFGVHAPGGFDCSGFVWRVFKLQAYPNEGTLATVLQGRTTYAMSGEVPAAKRVPLSKLQPADVLFFGAHGPNSKPAQINHTGIYLGNGWFIHSSGYGVAGCPPSRGGVPRI